MKTFLKQKKTSLSYAPLYASFIVILLTSGFIGIYWSIDKFIAYNKTVVEIRERYTKTYRDRLEDEMKSVVDFIDFKRSQTDQRIEQELQQKVQIAYVTASHMYSLFKHSHDETSVQTMIIEALRPLRWNTNLGYYFVGEIETGKFLLLSDRPQYERKEMIDYVGSDGKYFVRDIIRTVNERGAGILQYMWKKPGEGEEDFQKISFVRHFRPFNWFLGAGIYADDMERTIQKDVIVRLSKVEFGQQGSVACFTMDGDVILDFEGKEEKKHILDIKDGVGNLLGEKLHAIAKGQSTGGFLKASVKNDNKESMGSRLYYTKLYADWDWVIVASINEGELEAAIENESTKYRHNIFRDITIFMIIYITTMLTVLFIAYSYSLRIRKGVALFTAFFKEASTKEIRLEESDLTFSEFIDLGKFANQMVSDRIKKDRVIKRDEVRLDTLFKLSLMEGYSLKEICGFTLEKMLEITESSAGYIGIVKEGSFTMVAVQLPVEERPVQCIREDLIRIDEINSCGKAFITRDAVISNSKNSHCYLEKYPDVKIHRHLDIPIFVNDEVVAVVGVANKQHGYVEADLRQLTIIQEGMWFQIIKNRTQKELEGLRNLLKSINDSMPSVIISVDGNFNVIQWNKHAEKITGISAEKAEGQNITSVYPSIDVHRQMIRRVIDENIAEEKRKNLRNNDGVEVYENLYVSPLVDDNIQGAVIRIDDITDKVRLEDMMIQSEKMMSVGGLAAGIAHEINNPLAGILQNLQVLQTRLAPAFEKNIQVADKIGVDIKSLGEYMDKRGIHDILFSIDTSAKRAATLVKNMLSFSRKSDSIFSSANLQKLMDTTVDLLSNDYDLKKKYDFKKIKIVREYDLQEIVVPCESTNIQQVFMNLLKNSAHSLIEQNENHDNHLILIRIYKEKEYGVVEIEDSGVGIEEKNLKRIFEPFYTTKPVGIGTGLGLSISYFIIHDQHKGMLSCHSVKGKGATFKISLPLERKEISAKH